MQHAIALSRQLAAESLATDPSDPVTARQLAVAAWYEYPTDQAGSAMTTLLAEQQRDGMLPVVADDLVNDVAFSPNGQLLATADYDDGTVRLWNMSTGRPAGVALRADTGLVAGVSEVAFSPDGRLLATADEDGTVRLWNPASGQLIRSLPAGVIGGGGTHGVAFSPDGRLLATASLNGTVRLWNLATGQPVRSLLADPDSYNALTGVAFSPDGSLLATAELRRERPAVEPGHRSPGRRSPFARHQPRQRLRRSGVAFSRDGRLLATADQDGTARLWYPATGQLARSSPRATAPAVTA